MKEKIPWPRAVLFIAMALQSLVLLERMLVPPPVPAGREKMAVLTKTEAAGADTVNTDSGVTGVPLKNAWEYLPLWVPREHGAPGMAR